MRCVIQHRVISRAFQHSGKAWQRAGHGPVTRMRKCPCLADASIGLGRIIILEAVKLNGDHFAGAISGLDRPAAARAAVLKNNNVEKRPEWCGIAYQDPYLIRPQKQLMPYSDMGFCGIFNRQIAAKRRSKCILSFKVQARHWLCDGQTGNAAGATN